MSRHAHRSQRHQIPLDLMLQAVWADHCGCGEPNSGPLQEQFTLLNPWTISLAPILLRTTYFLSTILISLGFSPGDSKGSQSIRVAFVKLPVLGRKNKTKHEQGSRGCYCKSITQLPCPLAPRKLLLPKSHVKDGVISSGDYEGKVCHHTLTSEQATFTLIFGF